LGALTAQGAAEPRSSTPTAPAGPAAGEPDSITEASVSVSGHAIRYRAIAGTLTVGSTNELDALLGTDGRWMRNSGAAIPSADDPENAPATARMFYVAYFRTGAATGPRPIIFLYNGGPSVASLWLHMGAFGPRRISIPDTQHPSGGPYSLIENAYSLL